MPAHNVLALRGPALTGLSGPRMRPLCARFYAVVIEKFFIRRTMMGISYAIIDCVYVSLYVFEAFYVLHFLFIGAKHFSNAGIGVFEF